jgi:Ca2+-binding EF-hand superfamily protein
MSDPDLRERNIDAVFAVLDADADGFITSGDLTAIGTRVCEQLRIVGSPQATEIVASYVSWWEQLRADCDANGDGQISRTEFAHAMFSGGGDPQAYYSQQLGKQVSLLADAMDADGDGFIEPTEYLALFGAAPSVDPQVVQAAFERLDADGDGRISRKEFQAGIAQLFLSGDQASPGTGMLGQS